MLDQFAEDCRKWRGGGGEQEWASPVIVQESLEEQMGWGGVGWGSGDG
jgi:hypothetical protein